MKRTAILFQFITSAILILTATSSETQDTSDKNTYKISTKMFNKTICTCRMNELSDYESLYCPTGYKFEIKNAYFFDIRNETCSFKTNQFVIKFATNDIQEICTESICNITLADLMQLSFNPNIVVECLAFDIIWNCYKTLANFSITNQSNPIYSFTYFFYVVTLILTSFCILIGIAFIFRRFVSLRRHDHLSSHHMIRHTFPSNQHAHMNSTGVWSTAYLPPSYDNIYETSVPVNLGLPDYEAALSMNSKQFVHKQNSDDPVVFRSDLNEQPIESSFITFNNITTVTNPFYNSNTNQNSITSNNPQASLETDDANSSNSAAKLSK